MRNGILLILLITTVSLFAHGGRTDKNGGHHDRINGGYHYHNDGNLNSNNDYYSNNNDHSGTSKYSKNSDWSNNWLFWVICACSTIFLLNLLESLGLFDFLKKKIKSLIFLFYIVGALFFTLYGIYLLFRYF